MGFWLIVGAILLGILFVRLRKDYVILALCKKFKTVSGVNIETVAPIVKGKTIFGNNFDILNLDFEGLFMLNRKLASQLGKSYIQYIMASPVYNIITAKDAELVFNDTKLITKGIVYTYLQPFIKTGLLTSTRQKWHSRRKILTPAFHFSILEEFLDIFKEESRKFQKLLEQKNGEIISLTDLIPRITLNIICETAMGVNLDERKDGDTYRRHLDDIEKALFRRIANPFYVIDFIWEHFGDAKKYQPSFDGVHEFSSNIIKKKRALFEKTEDERKKVAQVEDDDDIYISKKRRYAMLDTLLKAEKEGLIDHEGICEEVDTFIFEGFDTTSMGLIFGIMSLSMYPEIQERCFEEIQSLIGDDLSQLTIPQINKLEYLDRVIKEILRLFPSVPVIMREAVSETPLANNILLPKGAQIAIHIYDIHRREEYFKNPNNFDPDRFLPENSNGRHPFAFVPFSAGSRNCIGQKFALLEMKTVLIHFLKNFKAFQVGDPSEYRYEFGFLLRVSHNVKVRIEKRT